MAYYCGHGRDFHNRDSKRGSRTIVALLRTLVATEGAKDALSSTLASARPES